MKKLYSFAVLLVYFCGNAQLSMVKEFPFSKAYPGTPFYPKSTVNYRAFVGDYNVWNNKAIYVADYYFQPCLNNCSTLNLVVTDGTGEGTKVIKNIVSQTVSKPVPYQFKPAGNFMYFTLQYAGTSATNYELWRTDGTLQGTLKVDEMVNVYRTDSQYYPLEISADLYNNFQDGRSKGDAHIGNDFFYLKYTATVSGQDISEIWKTDGTAKVSLGSNAQLKSRELKGGLVSFNNNLYFIDKDSNLVKFDGSTFTKPVVFAIGDTGQGAQGVVTAMYNLGIVFKNKLYFLGKINNVIGIYSLDSNGNITFIYNPGNYDSSIVPYQFMKTKDRLVFNGNTCTVTDGSPGNYTVLYNNSSELVDKMFTDDDNIFFITRPIDTSTMMNGKIFRANSDGSGLISVFFDRNYAPNSYADYKIYKNTLWFNYRLPDAPNSVGEELWRTDGIGLSQAFDQYTEIFGGYNGSFGASYFFKLNDEMYFFGLKNSSTNALYRLKGDFTFNNSQNDSKWSNADNWNVGLTPLTQNDAIIPSGFTPNVDADAFAKNLSVASPLNLSSGSLYITGNLELNSKITLNNNAVNLKGTSSNITGGNATNYIVTNGTGTVNVENLNAERGTVNLPIGTATNYNPISLSNSGTSDTFSARVSEGIANTTNGAVNATWEIFEATAGGSNVSLTLGWNPSQQNAAFDSLSAKVGHYLNGSWSAENSGAVSNNSITATGISSFSPFAVMNFGALAASDFSKSKVLIYPNPFNENLNISTENGGVVYFYDLSGKLVSTSILMKGTNSLNKSSLAKGVYIYQIRNTIGEILSSGKVIKK